MDYTEFKYAMDRAFLVTGVEARPLMYSAYFEEFKHLDATHFRAAMACACRDLKHKFPSVAHIYEAMPSSHRKTDAQRALEDLESVRKQNEAEAQMAAPGSGMDAEYPAGAADLEAFIDNLTNEQLFEIFRFGIGSHVTIAGVRKPTDDRNFQHGVQMFRRNPRGLYRAFVRDILEAEGTEWLQADDIPPIPS